MRKLLILGVLVFAGCQNIAGPLQYREPVQVDDPGLPIWEQERIARDRLALPVESFEMGPHSGFARPGINARQPR